MSMLFEPFNRMKRTGSEHALHKVQDVTKHHPEPLRTTLSTSQWLHLNTLEDWLGDSVGAFKDCPML